MADSDSDEEFQSADEGDQEEESALCKDSHLEADIKSHLEKPDTSESSSYDIDSSSAQNAPAYTSKLDESVSSIAVDVTESVLQAEVGYGNDTDLDMLSSANLGAQSANNDGVSRECNKIFAKESTNQEISELDKSICDQAVEGVDHSHDMAALVAVDEKQVKEVVGVEHSIKISSDKTIKEFTEDQLKIAEENCQSIPVLASMSNEVAGSGSSDDKSHDKKSYGTIVTSDVPETDNVKVLTSENEKASDLISRNISGNTKASIDDCSAATDPDCLTKSPASGKIAAPISSVASDGVDIASTTEMTSNADITSPTSTADPTSTMEMTSNAGIRSPTSTANPTSTTETISNGGASSPIALSDDDCTNHGIKSIDETEEVSPAHEATIGTKSGKQTDDSVLDKNTTHLDVNMEQSAQDDGDGWGSWENWAEGFVQQATNQVSTLIEKVETQLGIPDPADMASLSNEPIDLPENTQPSETTDAKDHDGTQLVNQEGADEGSSWFSGFTAVSAITNLVQNSSQDLIAGSIDALEFIGKKTVDLISDGDPGLRSKREGLGVKKSTLSSVLREAQTKNTGVVEEKSELECSMRGEELVKFNVMFDKFQGSAHLDALEMLSNDCESKLERILAFQSDEAKDESMSMLVKLRENLNISEEEDCENEAPSDFKKDVFSTTKSLQLKVMSSKLLNTWSKLKDGFNDISADPASMPPRDIYGKAISCFAEFSARCIEFYRKIADMLMMTDITAKQYASDRACSLTKLTSMFESELTRFASSYADMLVSLDTTDENKELISHLITDVYIEASSSTAHMRDAHGMLLPILQCSAIK